MRTTIELYFTLCINSLFMVVSHLHKRQLDQALRALENIQSAAPRKLAEFVLGGSEFLLLLVFQALMQIANRFASGLVGFLTLWATMKIRCKAVTPIKLLFLL